MKFPGIRVQYRSRCPWKMSWSHRSVQASGGADDFHRFIGDELIRFVDSSFPTVRVTARY